MRRGALACHRSKAITRWALLDDLLSRGVPCGAKLPGTAVALILLSLSLLSLVSIVKSFTCRKTPPRICFSPTQKKYVRKRFLYSNFTRLDALSTLPTTLLSRFYKQLGWPKSLPLALDNRPRSGQLRRPSPLQAVFSSGHRAPTSQTALAPRPTRFVIVFYIGIVGEQVRR